MLKLLLSVHMANTRPFVAVACFCDSVVEDKTGAMSAIRIIDTYNIPQLPAGAQLPDGLKGVVVLNGLIVLKSGDVQGTGTLRLIMHRTNGEQVQLGPAEGWPMVLNGGEHGATLRIQMPLGVKNFGLLWFDVVWNDEVLTRIPLRLKLDPSEESTAPS
jgi:hypothetical protein